MVTVRCTVCSAKSARHSKRLATPTVHTASIAISLLVYIFALKNKKTTHLDTEQGHAWTGKNPDAQAPGARDADDDKKELVDA